MNKLVKILLITIPTAAMIGGVSANAVADDYGKKGGNCGYKHKHGGMMMGGMSERMQKKLVRKLDLTDAQEVSLKEIFATQSVDIQSQYETAQAMFDELTQLPAGSAEYNAQVDKIAQSRANHMATSMKAWGSAQSQIMAMLNEEQQEEFQEMLDYMSKRMKGRG